MDDKCSSWKHQQRSCLSLFSAKCFSITVQFCLLLHFNLINMMFILFSQFLLQGPSSPGVPSSLKVNFLLKNNSLMAMVQHKVNIIHALMRFCFVPVMLIYSTSCEMHLHIICVIHQELWKSGNNVDIRKNCAEWRPNCSSSRQQFHWHTHAGELFKHR